MGTNGYLRVSHTMSFSWQVKEEEKEVLHVFFILMILTRRWWSVWWK
jgi:hypothetical protein